MQHALCLWRRQVFHTFADHTQTNYWRVCQRFADSAPENLYNITAEHIENYLQSLIDSGMAASGVNRHLFALRSFFRWAESISSQNPAKNVRKFRELPPKQCLITEAEYQKILDACKPDERKIIELLANTGLRSAELRSLRPESINGDFLVILGKNNNVRRVPLNHTAKSIVSKPDFFKLAKNNKNFTTLCRRIERRLANLHFGPHSFRHRFATEMLKAGCDIYKLSRILGHKSLKSTIIYTHLISDDLQGACDILDK